jgi:hypothetical protein
MLVGGDERLMVRLSLFNLAKRDRPKGRGTSRQRRFMG